MLIQRMTPTHIILRVHHESRHRLRLGMGLLVILGSVLVCLDAEVVHLIHLLVGSSARVPRFHVNLVHSSLAERLLSPRDAWLVVAYLLDQLYLLLPLLFPAHHVEGALARLQSFQHSLVVRNYTVVLCFSNRGVQRHVDMTQTL